MLPNCTKPKFVQVAFSLFYKFEEAQRISVSRNEKAFWKLTKSGANNLELSAFRSMGKSNVELAEHLASVSSLYLPQGCRTTEEIIIYFLEIPPEEASEIKNQTESFFI